MITVSLLMKVQSVQVNQMTATVTVAKAHLNLSVIVVKVKMSLPIRAAVIQKTILKVKMMNCSHMRQRNLHNHVAEAPLQVKQ